MAEKEIDITSGQVNDLTPQPGNPTQDKPEVLASNQFSAVRSDLSARAEGKSASDLLDEIIHTNESELIPWEEVTLPSKGLWYHNQIPGGLVKVRAMGAFADKILATARLAQTGQSIDYLLEHCVQLPNEYKGSDLLAGDRIFLLYVLRGITHGNMYEFMLTCPQCEAVNTYTYDLNELSSTITPGNPGLGDEPFKVVLPYLSEITGREVFVRVRLLRGTDVSNLARRQRFKKKVSPASPRSGTQRQVQATVDDSLTENLNLIVVDWMGEVRDPAKIKALIEKLHSSDLAAIREFLKGNSPGIDTMINVTCPGCSTEFKTELPITENFFRPTQRRGIRP